MNSDRWKQIEALYNSALELSAAEREDYLSVACAGDDGLRREVEALLSASDTPDSFMEEPALSLGMALMRAGEEPLAGSSVGRYKLIELLGRGGMGEVYLAHDPRLNRRVALKLLPPGIYDDSDRVLRFEHEARAASAISHPGVAHVYEIGEEGGRHYITMEYVRGRTLREILKKGPLDVGQALDVAVQVAQALAAAHEAGVVHRDIKPENIMLGADGYVKVLDFGLAKLIESSPYAAEPEQQPLPSLHTEPELLMGTSDYMSPEQVRRLQVDARTDVWSLGVVIYEMLAGRRPFCGHEASEVIISILEREPAPIERLRRNLPDDLRRIVARALSKRPADRYRSASDMASALRAAQRRAAGGGVEAVRGTLADAVPAHPTQEPPGPATSPQELPASTTETFGRPLGPLDRTTGISVRKIKATSPGGRGRAARWLALLPLVCAGLYIGFARHARRTLQAREISLRFERLNLSGGIGDVALSPDGNYVASVVTEEGRQAIHITELATASDLRVVPPSTAGYSGLSFSPDGTFLYYLEDRAETGTLYRVSKLGGGQRKILENVNTAVTFSPDGGSMAFVRSNNAIDPADLVVARADGTSARVLAKRALSDKNFFLSDMRGPAPAWSPDGKVLACATRDVSRGLNEVNVEAVDPETGAARRLNVAPWYDISRVVWLADGSGLLLSAVEAQGAPWQLLLLAYPGGGARKVTNDPNSYSLVSGSHDSGKFLTLNIEESDSIWVLSLAGASQPGVASVTERKGVSEVEWGATGGVFTTVFDGVHANLWSQGAGEAARQLTFDADNFKPAASPDGRYVVFVSTRAGAMNVWRINADGTHPIRLTAGAYEDNPSVTPDGKWVVYRTGTSVKKVPIEGGDSTLLFNKSALSPALSPDGRLIAFFTNDQSDSQDWHIEVYDLVTLSAVKRFGLPRATTPFNSLALTPDNRLRWSPDGHGVAYVSNADGASNVWLQPLGGGAPRRLTSFRDAEITSFAWPAGNRQLACVRITKAYVPVLVRLF